MVSFLRKKISLNSGARLAEVHAFERLGKLIVFNVESLLFYEVDAVTFDLIRTLATSDADADLKPVGERHGRRSVATALEALKTEGLLHAASRTGRIRSRPRAQTPRNLELMVTHRCNLRCRYCYGAHGPEDWIDATHLYGDDGAEMTFETARKAVELLFRISRGQKHLSIVFFGGEPLLAFPLVRQVVEFGQGLAAERGRKVSYSLSTNGLGLNEEVIDFLETHRIGCQVSIDGPPSIHDAWRVAADGSGSYSRILPGIRRLIQRRPGRVPARATLGRGSTQIGEVVRHLLKLGFGSVHVEPAIGADAESCINENDVERIQAENEALAWRLVESVRENRIFHYTNLVRNIRQTRVVRHRLQHYCGAGRTYLAVGRDGSIYPCHRFVGLPEYRMGNVESGLGKGATHRFEALTVDRRPGCSGCWARYLCGGGCWKNALDATGTLERPDEERSCRIQKHLIECAMAVNTELGVKDSEILAGVYEESAEVQFL